ncbi:phenyloxazoline synthase mbtB [Pyrenophora tritici-repentis]|nr:phenyloxazoline synthase mbtB [Pyrenophora tritici-repentis]PZD25571.1 phenyloxazoline synthase mbtB [Pyrenophora tritici-repentis]
MNAVASFGVNDQSNKPGSEVSTYTIGTIASTFPQDDVEEIALATDWQAWCIGQGLLKPHGWHDYMVFKFKKPLDTDKLRNACQQLVERHAILRTIFSVKERQAFQVILKSKAYPFQFAVKDSVDGKDMDQDVEETIQQDMKRHTQLGDPLVAFTLVKDATDSMHQLILRISHAQYDALSLDKLPLEVIPFTKFYAEASLASTNSESHWKEALTNSSMSQLRTHTRPSVSCPINSVVKASIPLVDLNASGFTTATAVFAAWSIVLSKLTGQDSVVFGYIISGRHLPMAKISEVLGPCMNVLSLHANVSSTGQTASLLSSIQSSYLKSLQHGNLGHHRIIEKCTNWPRWTHFSSIVNHLSFAFVDPPFSEHGGCDFNVHEPEHDKADIWLQTFAQADELEVELRYSAETFCKDWVKTVLDYFTTVYQQLPDVLERQISETLPKTSVTVPQDVPVDCLQQMKVDSPPLPEYPKALEEIVLSSWESVLGADFKSHPGFTHQTPFYEIWGNGIAAAALASEYSKRGYSVSSEEVLDFPSVGETVAHLLTRTKSESP